MSSQGYSVTTVVENVVDSSKAISDYIPNIDIHPLFPVAKLAFYAFVADQSRRFASLISDTTDLNGEKSIEFISAIESYYNNKFPSLIASITYLYSPYDGMGLAIKSMKSAYALSTNNSPVLSQTFGNLHGLYKNVMNLFKYINQLREGYSNQNEALSMYREIGKDASSIPGGIKISTILNEISYIEERIQANIEFSEFKESARLYREIQQLKYMMNFTSMDYYKEISDKNLFYSIDVIRSDGTVHHENYPLAVFHELTRICSSEQNEKVTGEMCNVAASIILDEFDTQKRFVGYSVSFLNENSISFNSSFIQNGNMETPFTKEEAVDYLLNRVSESPLSAIEKSTFISTIATAKPLISPTLPTNIALQDKENNKEFKFIHIKPEDPKKKSKSVSSNALTIVPLPVTQSSNVMEFTKDGSLSRVNDTVLPRSEKNKTTAIQQFNYTLDRYRIKDRSPEHQKLVQILLGENINGNPDQLLAAVTENIKRISSSNNGNKNKPYNSSNAGVWKSYQSIGDEGKALTIPNPSNKSSPVVSAANLASEYYTPSIAIALIVTFAVILVAWKSYKNKYGSVFCISKSTHELKEHGNADATDSNLQTVKNKYTRTKKSFMEGVFSCVECFRWRKSKNEEKKSPLPTTEEQDDAVFAAKFFSMALTFYNATEKDLNMLQRWSKSLKDYSKHAYTTKNEDQEEEDEKNKNSKEKDNVKIFHPVNIPSTADNLYPFINPSNLDHLFPFLP